jgi:hypothetical protein
VARGFKVEKVGKDQWRAINPKTGSSKGTFITTGIPGSGSLYGNDNSGTPAGHGDLYVKEQGVAEGSLNELSSDLLQRSAQVAKNKSNQAMDPKIHDALGGGYMNPVARHYDTMSDKFSQKATSAAVRDKIKDIGISNVVQRKIAQKPGVAEGKRNLKCVCKTHGQDQCLVHAPIDEGSNSSNKNKKA